MLYTVKLFVILAIVGGAIAWLGDVVGARLGKKRSSLFCLRPRQTARLVAVAIGAALLGATFLVIADVLARSLFSPIELSIGVITTLVGAPFFLWLLLRERGLLAR